MRAEELTDGAGAPEAGSTTPATKLSSGELAVHYQKAWSRAANRILGAFRIPQADREDLLQEVFTDLFVRRDHIANPQNWFMVALRNRCRRYYRDQALAVKAAAIDGDRARADTRRRSISK